MGITRELSKMEIFESNDIKFPILTIVPSLVGSALLISGLSVHPLMEIVPKSGGDVKQISIWQITTQNSTKTWQKYIGSPSPMPVEIAAATLMTSVLLSLSSFFKLRPATKLVSAHGLILSSFFGVSAVASMVASFSIHHTVTPFYTLWLAVTGIVLLFFGGLLAHIGKQMDKSSNRFSLSNIIFYILAGSSAALFFTALGLATFGDSSQYCTVPELRLCEPFEPLTKVGLFKICEGELNEGQVVNEICTEWGDFKTGETENYQWVLSLTFALYFFAGLLMLLSLIVKLLWDTLRGISTTLVVCSLGCSMAAQCIVSCLVTGYYHRYTEPYNELRYDAQYYGDAYYIGLAGLITTAISLASILGEESPAVNYMSTKKSAIFDSSQVQDVDSPRSTKAKGEDSDFQ